MEIVELRVHGVHGTSPGSMLGVDQGDVGQVAGDSLTGIYRADGKLPYRNLEKTDVSVEAYSWGALTSGVQGLFGWIKRALWLLLLPFALANLSYWARLHMAEDSATARWGARATRIGAILLTMFMVLMPCLLAIDLVAWQCYRGDSPGCPSLPGVVDFMARFDSTQRLAAGSLVPLASIALLWFLSRQSMIRYEEVVTVAEEGADAPMMMLETGRVDVLRHPRLWQGKDRTLQLQRIHLTVALGVVVAFTGVHVVALPSKNPAVATTTSVIALVLMVVAIAWSCIIHPDDIDYFANSRSTITAMRRKLLPSWLRRLVRDQLPEWLLRTMVVVTGAHLFALAFLTDPLNDKGDFVGRNLWFIGVFVLLTAVHLSVFMGGRMRAIPAVVVVVLVLLLAAYALVVHWYALPGDAYAWADDLHAARKVVGFGSVLVLWGMLSAWHIRQGRKHRTEAWNGAAASFMLAAAAWVGLLFTTGIVTASADFLNGDGHGVDDLVTKTEEITDTLAPNRATVFEDGRRELTASGDVTAKDAVIVRGSGGRLTVIGGKVETESLFEAAEAPDERLEGLRLSLDSTRVREAQVDIPNPYVAIQDSCIRDPGSRSTECSAEDADFIAAGTLPLPSKQLSVDAGDNDPVTVVVTKPPQMPLAIPQVLIWSPLMQFVWIIAVVVFLAVALLLFARSRKAIDDFTDTDPAIAERDKAAARGARNWAAFAHRAEKLLDGIGAITAVIAILVIVFSATGEPPWAKVPWTRNIATLSMYVVLGLAAGLVFLASRLRTSDQARKGIGVLWDLTTFWPRAAHPLAPPCYAERVVPELRTRVNWALGSSPDTRLVLSGHSQGSAILAALVSRLSRRDLERVRIITYGSQIRALYGRVFPRVLGPEAIGYVETPGPTELWDAFPDAPSPKHPAPPAYVAPAPDPGMVTPAWEQQPLFDRVFLAGGEWANLFRRTDPLGFRIFSDADAAPDHVVPEVPPRSAGDPGPMVQGHSGYQHTLVYRRKLHAWTGEPVVEPADGTLDLPAIPPP